MIIAQTYGAFPDLIECKIEGKVIDSKTTFSKPECFDIYNLSILSTSNTISNQNSIAWKNETCLKNNFHIGYGIESIIDLPQYNQNSFGTGNIFIKISENFSSGINHEKTFNVFPVETLLDNQWNVSIDSMITGVYKEKPSNFDSLPECPGYPLGVEKTQTGSIQKIDSISQLEKSQEILSGIQGIIIGIILGCFLGGTVYKFLFRKK